MSSDFLAQAEAIFIAAVKLPLENRQKFLDEKCSADSELRQRVDRLLALDDQGIDGFLEPPEDAANPTFSQAPVEGSWVDRFQLVRKIGQGGMGQVYLAQQQKPQRDVALKILRSDLANPPHARRFKLEIEVLGRLNHPGIAQIYDAGTTEDGHPYFAMEYVPGKPLADFLQENDLSAQERLQLAIQICEAVNYANEQGIIHRDLKPANILVVDHGQGNYQTKVLDFGVARLTRDIDQAATLDTMPGQLLGTLAYMSPEQAAGNTRSINPSSDVYQLGVILYEMLAGKLPLALDSESIPEAVRRIVDEDPPNLGSDDHSLRGDLEIIVAKAMAKEPERRYTIAGELASDIRRFLNQEPIVARPTTTFYLLRKKFHRRRSAVLGLLAVAAVSLTAGWILFNEVPAPVQKAPTLTMLTPTVPAQAALRGPAISPDGSQLVVLAPAGHLKLMSIPGKQEKSLLPGIENEERTIAACWHPDGQKLLLTRVIKNIEYQQVWYDLASGDLSPIISGEEPLYPVISPDGKSAIVRRNNFREMAIMNLATGDIQTIAETDGNRQFHTPVWGPSGQRIAFVQETQKTSYRLQCMDLEGNTTTLLLQTLLQTGPRKARLCWLSDGQLIYAQSRELSGVDVDLWSMPMDSKTCQSTGEPQLVFSIPTWQIYDLTYSATTGRVTFSGLKIEKTISVFNISQDGSLKKNDLQGSGWPGRPKSFVNDGKHLVIRETRSGNDTDVLLQDITTGEFKPLLIGPGNDNPISMSPDGRHLFLFRSKDDDMAHAELWAHCLADSQTTYLDYTLAVEDYYKWISSPVRAGGSSYLFSQWGTDLVVREISAENGVGPEMLRMPISADVSPGQSLYSVDMSPDAKQFAYLVNRQEVLIYDLDTKETVSLPLDLGYPQKLQWSVDGKWIYLNGMMNPEATYWFGRVEVATGQTELLWGSESQWANEFFMSQDGKHLSCQIVEMKSALGMLEGF